MGDTKQIDVNTLPVHLFVKCQKQAKKLKKEQINLRPHSDELRKTKRYLAA